jgi:putative glutamine amidotransferase
VAPVPLIVLPAQHVAAGSVRGWERGGFAIPDGYVACLQRAGLRPIIVAGSDPSTDVLDTAAGLLLAGGGDVEPSRYGAEAHPKTAGIDRERDELEVRLVREAIARDVPVFAICRGMQVLNVALGGTLHQHVPDIANSSVHSVPLKEGMASQDVRVDASSRLFGIVGERVKACACHHHQSVDQIGDGLVATAWSDDGILEGVEHTSASWVVGVQWHPERTAHDDPVQQSLFEAFAEVCRA